MPTWPRNKYWRIVACGIIHWTAVKGNVRGFSSSQYFVRTTCTGWCCDVGANVRRTGRVSRRFTATSTSWLWINLVRKSVRTHFCESVNGKRSMLISSSGADQIDYNQLRSILMIAFLIAFACVARTFQLPITWYIESKSRRMPKHYIKVWDALWPLKYYCSTRFI